MKNTSKTNDFEALKKKLQSKQARVGVVGLGYVGLPLSVAFAEAGYSVIGFDIDKKRVQRLAKGESDIPDIASSVLSKLVSAKKFLPTTDFDLLTELDAVSICVPTPLRKTRDPDISYIVAAVDQIEKRMGPGKLIVLESTTYPGTTREILLPKLEKNGLKLGENLFIAFSPERVDPGNTKFGIRNTPKVIGGLSERCTELATLLYAAAVEKVVSVSSAEAAELVKLLENTFRAVNIGLVNEMALVCDKLHVNVWEVIEAAATKPFGFMPFFPGPGLGGHCIPIDPHYLAWKLRTLDYKVRFIELADDINRFMPEHVVNKTAQALNEMKKPIHGSRILIVGMAYKKNVGDVRESPSLDIAKMLHENGAELSYYDPYVNEISVDAWKVPALKNWDAKSLKSFDAAIIATDHKTIDYSMLVKNCPLVIDTRNATKGLEELGRIRKL